MHRMHSSRMRTARSLLYWGGVVSVPHVQGSLSGGMSLSGGSLSLGSLSGGLYPVGSLSGETPGRNMGPETEPGNNKKVTFECTV